MTLNKKINDFIQKNPNTIINFLDNYFDSDKIFDFISWLNQDYDINIDDVGLLQDITDLGEDTIVNNVLYNYLSTDELEDVKNQIAIDYDLDNDNLEIESEDMTKTCSICGKKFKGYGNNDDNGGLCCDECNKTVVIPERLKKIRDKDSKTEAEYVDYDSLYADSHDGKFYIFFTDEGYCENPDGGDIENYQIIGIEKYTNVKDTKDLLDSFIENNQWVLENGYDYNKIKIAEVAKFLKRF